MTTFKEYRNKKQEDKKKERQYEAIETSCCSHSVKKKPDREYEAINTSLGKHSENKINEELEIAKVSDYKKSPKEHERIHQEIAPLDPEKLSAKEIAATSDYTNSSSHINEALLNHYNLKRSSIYFGEAQHLTNMLNKHKTNKDIDVYTGIGYSPVQHFKPDTEGNIPDTVTVHHPAFLSTSTKMTIANGFSRFRPHPRDELHGVESSPITKHVLHIHVPKGTSAASLMDHSHKPEENEILLNRGHNIEIDKTPKRMRNSTYVWNARIKEHKPVTLD